MTLSLIVTTFDWPQALGLVLRAVARQNPLPDEVIVADDGSGAPTRALLQRIARAYPVPLRHVWQEHRGFRAGAARNRAVAAARGEYVIFLDGDMLPQRHFIADHLAAARPDCFTQGARALASAALTARLLERRRIEVSPFARGLDAQGNALRLSAAALLRRPRTYGRKRVMSCNQGFWRADLLGLNGFDERMAGWGREDTELAVRCYRAGIRRLQLRHAAIAVHLHHVPRGNGDTRTPNDAFLAESERSGRIRCELGIDRYLAEFAAPPPDLRVLAEQPACA
jgi:glycosyltransferase involved in cell wall biosynthesis